MTQSPLPMFDRPRREQWTLWTRWADWRRPKVPHWTFRRAGPRDDLEAARDEYARDCPGLETLVLPVGERPLLAKRLCHRKRRA
jgi:hypothetical protein